MTNSELIQRIARLESLATVLLEEAVKTRKELERINAPAPRKGRRKKGQLTPEEQAEVSRLFAQYKKRQFKNTTINTQS